MSQVMYQDPIKFNFERHVSITMMKNQNVVNQQPMQQQNDDQSDFQKDVKIVSGPMADHDEEMEQVLSDNLQLMIEDQDNQYYEYNILDKEQNLLKLLQEIRLYLQEFVRELRLLLKHLLNRQQDLINYRLALSQSFLLDHIGILHHLNLLCLLSTSW